MIGDGCLSKGRRKQRKNRSSEKDTNIGSISSDEVSELQDVVPEINEGEMKQEIDDAMTELSGELDKIKEDLRSTSELLDKTQVLSRTGSFELELTDGTILGSEMFFEIFGISKDLDLSIEMILSYIHPDDFDRMDGFINSLFNGENTQNIEFRFVNPIQLMELILTIKTVTVPSGRYEGKKVIGIAQEITGHKVAENTLLDSENVLADLNRAMIDRETRVIEMKDEVNQLCKDLGLEPRYSNFGN